MSGLTSGNGGVAHESAHVQNKKAGSPDSPNTRLSTTTIEQTVHTTRPVRAQLTAKCTPARNSNPAIQGIGVDNRDG